MKRTVSGISAVLCFLLIFAILGITASAESLYKQKIVYFLLDNSGSMTWTERDNETDHSNTKNRWNSAVYALESLASLLNEDDRLAVRSVGAPDKNNRNGMVIEYTEGQMTNDRLTQFLDYLYKTTVGKNKRPSLATPFTGVERLYDALEGKYRNASLTADQEIWFVVTTDGQFQGKKIEGVYDFLKEKVAGQPLGGIYPQVLYLTICPGREGMSIESYIEANGDTRITEYTSPDVKSIVRIMDQISDRISGRIRYDNSRYVLEGNSIRVQADFPMRDLVVMIQSQEEYGDISVSGLAAGNRKANIISPGENLKAYVRQFQKADGSNIPEGEYVIDLGRTPGSDDVITILFQPALGIRNTYTVTDRFGNETVLTANELSAKKDLYIGQKVQVRVDVVEIGNEKQVYPIETIAGLVNVRSRDSILTSFAENTYEYTVAAGDNILTTEVVLQKHGNQTLRAEVTFHADQEDPLGQVGQAEFVNDDHNRSATQLEMIQKGVTVTFKVAGKLEKSLAEYYQEKALTVQTGLNHAEIQMIEPPDSAQQISFRITHPETAPEAGNYSAGITLLERVKAEGTIQISASSLSLLGEGGNTISVSLMELKKNAVSKKIILTDSDSLVEDITGLTIDVSQVPGASYANGVLSFAYASELQPGDYTIQADPFHGLPIGGAITLHITDGAEEAAVSANDKVDGTEQNRTISQVDLFENGTNLVFPISHHEKAVEKGTVEKWIKEGIIALESIPDGLETGSVEAIEGGVNIPVNSKWTPAGDYEFKLRINQAASAGKLTVQESTFSIPDTMRVGYEDYVSGNAVIQLTELKDGNGKELSLQKYQVALTNEDAGLWDAENLTFQLNGKGNTKKPILLDYSVMGENKGQLQVIVEDPLGDVQTVQTDPDTENQRADLSLTQWQICYPLSEITLHFKMSGSDGAAVTAEKAKSILPELTVSCSDKLILGELVPENGGYRFVISVPAGQKYSDISIGKYPFVLKRGNEAYAQTILEVTASDVKTANMSPAVKWTSFRDQGYDLHLTLADNGSPLPADASELRIQIGEEEKIAPERANEKEAVFHLPYRQEIGQGGTLTLDTFARSEKLNQQQLTFENAAYDIAILENSVHEISQAELAGGGWIQVQLLEDGKPTDPAELQLNAATSWNVLEDQTESNSKTRKFRIGCEDAMLAPGNYEMALTGKGITKPYTISVTDSGYRLKERSKDITIDPRDMTGGYSFSFDITYDQGKKVGKDQILNLMDDLPEHPDQDESIQLNWDAPEDGILRCRATTDRKLSDFFEEKTYTIGCKLKSGQEAQVSVLVKQVFYHMGLEADPRTIVHTRLQDKESAYVMLKVFYADESGQEQGPVPTDELQQWIDDPSLEEFKTSFEYIPEDTFWTRVSEKMRSWWLPGRERLVLRLETTGEDGKIKAYIESPWNYEGLGGLQGYWHNAGNRWFMPVGSVKLTVEMKGDIQNSQATAEFRIIRDEPLPEALYFWVPLYLFLSVLRALFKKKFPWRRLQVAALTQRDGEWGYRTTAGVGFFFKKVSSFFFWPLLLIPNTLRRIFSKEHRDFWTEKNVRVSNSITVRVVARDRLPWPLRGNKRVVVVLGNRMRYRLQQISKDRTGRRQHLFDVDNIGTVFKPQPGSKEKGPELVNRSDGLLIAREGEVPAYGILMKQNI